MADLRNVLRADIGGDEAARDTSAFSTRHAAPYLVATFAEPQNMLSWSLTRPGFVVARSVAWLQVSDADLPLDVDPVNLLRTRMERAGYGDAVHLMTSRNIDRFESKSALAGDVRSSCLATVGLSNAGRVGEPHSASALVGTINLLAHVDRPLCQAARIEALSIATQARTAAVMDLGLSRDGAVVTGTGTDCIVLASPLGEAEERFAGLHTDVGISLGKAVYDAVLSGGLAWVAERRA